jgi:quercetin dioxygenase-like cupin family protein
VKKLVLAALVVAGAAFGAEPKAADKAAAPKFTDPRKESTYIAAGDLQWGPMDPTHPDGPQIAIAAGNPKTGPVAVFMKFPAGFDSGWHTHKTWYTSTVVKGVMTSQGQGDAAAKELPVGSYFGEPANKNHKNTCSAAGECILFGYMDKGVTFEPKTADGKNPPKEVAKKEEKKDEGKKDEAPGQAKKEEAKKEAPGQAKKEEKK